MRNNISKFLGSWRILLAAAALMLGLGATVQTASAGTVILEGSDAIGFHCPEGNASACTYRDQVWTAISGSSSLPIAAIGDVLLGSGTHTVDNFSSVAAAGSLSNYVALYFTAGGGCCLENDSTITAPGAQSAVAAFINAGGTVMIENYTGGSAWDFLIGAGGNGNANTAGYGGGLGSFGCSDGETVSALGILNGFTQPGTLSCWTHQAYLQSFFGSLGFTQSYFNAPPDAPNGGVGFSSLLSDGFTVTGIDNGGAGPTGIPEPLTLSLFGAGLAGAVVMRRRKARKA